MTEQHQLVPEKISVELWILPNDAIVLDRRHIFTPAATAASSPSLSQTSSIQQMIDLLRFHSLPSPLLAAALLHVHPHLLPQQEQDQAQSSSSSARRQARDVVNISVACHDLRLSFATHVLPLQRDIADFDLRSLCRQAAAFYDRGSCNAGAAATPEEGGAERLRYDSLPEGLQLEKISPETVGILIGAHFENVTTNEEVQRVNATMAKFLAQTVTSSTATEVRSSGVIVYEFADSTTSATTDEDEDSIVLEIRVTPLTIDCVHVSRAAAVDAKEEPRLRKLVWSVPNSNGENVVAETIALAKSDPKLRLVRCTQL